MIRDAIFIIAMLFGIGIALLVVNMAFGAVRDSLVDAPGMPQLAIDTIDTQNTRFSQVWDYTFLTIFVAVVIGSLLLSYYLATEPAIFFVVWIVVGLLSIVGGYLANAFDFITSDGSVGASATSFPILTFVLSNLLYIMIPVLFLMLIVFFAKPNGAPV